LIHEYLQQNKTVSLEKMGTFTVTGEPFITESNTITSQSRIDFVFDKKAETTPGLIEFIGASLNKNRNLVAADIESYLLETRQWINISKSYVLEGMGELMMDKNSLLQFRQMAPLSPKEEESRRRHPQVKETYSTEPKRNKKGGVFAFAMIIILLILGGAGWFVYNSFIAGKKNSEIISNDQPAPVAPDSTPKKAPDTATTAPKTDSVSHSTVQQPVSTTDSNHYKYIFEVTLNRDRAVSRTEQLNSYGNKAGFDSVPGGTFMRYRLYVEVTASSSDTLRIKDSLTKYLQRSILIKKY